MIASEAGMQQRRVYCFVQCGAFYHYFMWKIAIKFVVGIKNGCHWIQHPIRNYVIHTFIRWLAPLRSLCARRDHGIYFHIEILKMNRSKICQSKKQINRHSHALRMHVAKFARTIHSALARSQLNTVNNQTKSHENHCAHSTQQYMVYFVDFVATLTNFHWPSDTECV